MNCQTFFMMVILLGILACAIYACITIYKLKNREKFSSSKSPIINSSAFYNNIYTSFLNQAWSLMSSLGPPATMNVSYIDSDSVYYAAFFNSSSIVNLINGKIPRPVAYWSLTIYDSNGKLFETYNDKNTNVIETNNQGNMTYNFAFGNDASNPNILKIPNGNYAIVIRLITIPQTPTLGPSYLPNTNITNSSQVPNTTSTDSIIIPVTIEALKSNNIIASNQFWQYVNMSLASTDPTVLFPGINLHSFFLPAKNSITTVFQNPNEDFMIVFPSTKNIIKVTGNIPIPIGFSANIRSVSFCAGNFNNTQTDSSISCFNLPMNYVIFAAKSETEAHKYGYRELLGHKLLLWNDVNANPVLVYKVTSMAPIGLSTIDHSSKTIDGPTIQNLLGANYPVAVCFNEDSPSVAPESISQVSFTSSADYLLPTPSGMPSGMPSMPYPSSFPSVYPESSTAYMISESPSESIPSAYPESAYPEMPPRY